jgi:hypothetical protein
MHCVILGLARRFPMPMKECVCAQCSDWPPGDAPEYFQCEECKLYGTEDDFTHDTETMSCNECYEKAARASAVAAGIPLSVIDGKTKLSDHFSRETIDLMCNRKPQGDDE